MKKMTCAGLVEFTVLLLVMTLTGPQDVISQGVFLPLRLEDIEGTKIDLGTVVVTGKVVNPLRWDVTDVEVTVLFEEDLAEPLATQTIARIDTGASAPFSIGKVSQYNLQKFRFGITNYTLVSEDVASLLNLYSTSEDVVLRSAAVHAFNQMSARAIPALLEEVALTGRPTDISVEQMQTDLLCLQALTGVDDYRTVWPVLQLLAWYEQYDATNLSLIKPELLLIPYHPLKDLSLLQDFDYADGTLHDLLETFLANIGDSGVPGLLRATKSQNQWVRGFAQSKLIDLEKTTTTSILEESDLAILTDIVRALGEIQREDAVASLLELASADLVPMDVVDVSIMAIGKAGVSDLISGLANPNGEIAGHAERLLRSQAGEIVPELKQALQAQNLAIPVDAKTPEELVETLRESADKAINAQIDVAFEAVWALFSEQPCEKTLAGIEAIEADFASRGITTRYADRVGLVYRCRAQEVAETGNFEAAIALTLQAEQLNPSNPEIEAALTQWLIEQGQIEYKAGQWDKALGRFRFALQRAPDNAIARRWIGQLVMRANWPYALTGIASLLALVLRVGHKAGLSDDGVDVLVTKEEGNV